VPISTHTNSTAVKQWPLCIELTDAHLLRHGDTSNVQPSIT